MKTYGIGLDGSRRSDMRIVIVTLALALVGCRKQEPETKVDPKAPPAPLVPLPALPAAKAGPAYFMMGETLVRYDADGWTRIDKIESYGSSSFQLAPSLGRHVVVVGAPTKRLVDQKLVEITGATSPRSAHVGADGTVWAIAEDKVVRAATDQFVPETFTFDDPPRGLAIARDGEVWVHTLDRTYVKKSVGGTWRAADVSNVTGQVADILQIAAHPTGDLYLLTTIGLLRRAGNEWTAVHTGHEGEIAEVVPGPEGRFALQLRSYGTQVLGDPRGVRSLDTQYEKIVAIDAAGRVWSLMHSEIRVRDGDGKILQSWQKDATPAGAGGNIFDLLVFDGGPPIKLGERARGQVSGKIEGSAVGVQVIACSSSSPASGKEPCEGVDNARTTMTVSGGRFVLANMPVAPMRFWVKRGRWRDVDHTPCCETMQPDRTFDIGTVKLR